MMIQYVKEMRKLIGTRPLLICGASVIIINHQNKVLMLHRSDNDSWCFPGGSIDLGENLEDTARREVFEETGLEVENLEVFGVFSGEDLHYTYPHGDEVYIVDVVYKAKNLPSNISPPVKPVVKKLINQHI